MRLCNLPFDIQRLVLQAAARDAPANPKTWKECLPLLAVCRVWRELAAPAVYRYAYIHSRLPGDDGCPGLVRRASGLLNTECTVATNLELMQAVRSGRHVRAMDIELAHPVELRGYLEKVLGLLARTDTEWTRVSRLTLRLFPRRSSDAGIAALVPACGRALARLLPAVRVLTVAGGGDDGQTDGLLGSIASRYAAQLVEFHGNVPVALAAPAFSAELTHLRLSLDGRTQRLPRINAHALRSLSLYGVGSGFSWACFGDTQNPAVVNFASLRSIEITYGVCFLGDEDEDDGDGGGTGDAPRRRESHGEMEIRLPQLRKLRIVGCPASCALLEAGVFPEYLAQARVYGSSSALALISSSRLRRVGRLDINVQSLDAAGGGDFYTMSNRVFGARGPGTSSFLYVGRQVPVDPAMVEWTRLERLLVMSPLSAATLLALVARLPRLVSLVSFRTLLVDVSDACAAHSTLPGKARSHVERLGVIYDDTCAVEDAEMLVGHLLLGNTRLRSLTLPVAHMGMAKALVEQHRLAAPHLAGVALRPHF